MTFIPAPLRSAILLAAAATLVAACGGAAATPGPVATSGPDGTTTPAGTLAAGGTPGAASAAGGTSLDACTLLTQADIKEITGFAVAEVIPNPLDTIFPSACEWHVEGAAWQIVLGVTSPGGQQQWDTLVPYTQGTPVTGIGDEAFLSEMGGDLMVRRGDTFIDVQYVAVGEPKDTQDRLAKRVLEHLP